MARFGLVEPPPPPQNEIEYVAWFRFPVTWTYVSPPPSEVPTVLPMRAASASPATMTLVSTISPPPGHTPVAVEITPGAGGVLASSATAQWEMVIPKMARPSARPVDRIAAAPAPAPLSPAAPSSRAPVEAAPAGPFIAPLLLITPEDRFLARYWRHIVLAAIAIVALGFLLTDRSGSQAPSTRGRIAESSSTAGWSRSSILPAGRMLSVYEPSRAESDYRLEFSWVPDAKGVGWVFRTQAAGDYYATRLTLLQPGVNLVLAAEHFAVIGGAESAHARKVIRLANNSGLVRVRMDAIGPAFTLSLQGSPEDYWTDARLDSGALGFYDERGQRPEVQALRFTFIQKGATRTAVAALP